MTVLEKENVLFEAWAYCDYFDKSTEFMLSYMQDVSGEDLDYILEFIQMKSKERQNWYKENPYWLNKYNF